MSPESIAPAPSPRTTANGIINQKDVAKENPSKAVAVIAVLNAVTFAVPSLLRIFALNILESTVHPDIVNVIKLMYVFGSPNSG